MNPANPAAPAMDEPAPAVPRARYNELLKVIDWLLSVGAVARNAGTESAWEDAFSLVFSSNGSLRIADLRAKLGLSFDYYDLDASYQEDVEAYLSALESLKARLAAFAPAFSA
ncbi:MULTISPECIES: hypothetical protein [unclassified Variovorax]|uniref:hypothetical protein n=1 Tax=unclassified Variovorax TaxID=663243 RepID=UPI0013176481|nr:MULTISPECIES: hypothetical protein [unclassified Variovorax]VTU43566.1 hypothetical protein SRS16P1_00586 [Variovorax sp. SRS16]VTU43627.1 hypothetical protein E5P1_00580 [Variovorax sp. PBL-E5]